MSVQRAHPAVVSAAGLAGALALTLVVAGGPSRATPAHPIIPIPRADREVLVRHLGTNVIGRPVAAPPIDDAAAWFGLTAGTFKGRLTDGGKLGKRHDLVLTSKLDDDNGTFWIAESGPNKVDSVRVSNRGDVVVPSAVDLHHEVVSRFTPADPRVIQGIRAGGIRTFTIAVKVYELEHPTELEYTGSLDLTYTYIGAYRVTVPAGTYDAALFRWHYKGKVGPANVEDTVYRFYARGVGPVASLELAKISARLVYRNRDKIGVVLESFEPASVD